MPTEQMNDYMRDGIEQEAAALVAFKHARPTWTVTKADFYVRDPELRIGATPDFLGIDPMREGTGVIQVKSPRYHNFVRHWLEDPQGCPIQYRIQTIVEAKLCEASWAVLAAYLWVPQGQGGCHELHMVDIDIDDELWERVIHGTAEFWANFDKGISPPIHPWKDREAVKVMWPIDDGTTIDLSDNNRIMFLVDERIRLKAEIKDHTNKISCIETEIRDMMAEHTYGLLADGRRIQLKAITKEPYTVIPKPYREMRILKSRELE